MNRFMMYSAKSLMFFLFLLMLAFCNNGPSTTSAIVIPPAETTAPPSEDLVGLVVDAASQTLLLTVMSNGCTRKEDFKLSVQNEELVVERLRRDDCKRMPFATQLQFTFAEAGIDARKPFRVRNRFAAVFLN